MPECELFPHLNECADGGGFTSIVIASGGPGVLTLRCDSHGIVVAHLDSDELKGEPFKQKKVWR